jgi:hypothetical protein
MFTRKSLLLRLALSVITMVTALGAFGGVNVAQAANNDFDPSNIIDQSLFQNTGGMTAAQIQTFLNSQGGFLATWTDNVDMYSTFNYHDGNGNLQTTPSCLVHKATGMTAAQIIYQASTNWNPYYNTGWPKNGNGEITGCTSQNNVLDPQPNPSITTVSPQVILTTLQKEQSLITATGSYSQNSSDYTNATYPGSGNQYALSWAMGYGVPDAGGKDGTKRGFYAQVMYGAWQLRLNSECAIGHTTTSQWPGFEGYSLCGGHTTVGQTITIDGTATYLGNGATASMYSYTPHFSGNQHFVTLYEQAGWFGQVHPGATCATQSNVYRFWSPKFDNAHFYTSDPTEYARVLNDPNWTYEGVGFCALTSPATGYSAVYRFWSPKFDNVHFYTANAAEYNTLLSDPNWTYEGVAFYEPTASSTDTSAIAINRYWSPHFDNDHFYTGSVSEQNNLKTDPNWTLEGIGWYAEMPQ